MKKISRIVLIILLVNLFSSFTYAGVGDFPRPTSIEPVTTVEDATLNY